MLGGHTPGRTWVLKAKSKSHQQAAKPGRQGDVPEGPSASSLASSSSQAQQVRSL